jgi:hypothetical protein
MTTDMSPAQDFETIALAFLEERERHAGDTLARFIARYPQYARELTLLAFETATEEGQERQAVTPPTHLRERLRAEARAALLPRTDQALTSLLARGREHAGLAPRALAGRLDVGVDVLALLEERLITPDSIVRPFLARLAGVLGTSVDAVRHYLAAPPPPVARGVAYHAPEGHAPARRMSFAEAIAASNLTTPEQKARWLAPGADERAPDGPQAAE